MARPTKQWLDYFSMDVEKDNKLKFVKAKFWLIWFATYIELLQFVYKEWYYIEFNDDNMLLFMSETWLKEEETRFMLEFMLEKWLFIKDLYNKYKVLTSSWIQKRYAEWTKKRKNTAVYKWFRVAWDYDHIELTDTLTWLKEEETELKEEESTQRKGKKRKGNENSFQEISLDRIEEISNTLTNNTKLIFDLFIKLWRQISKEETAESFREWFIDFVKTYIPNANKEAVRRCCLDFYDYWKDRKQKEPKNWKLTLKNSPTLSHYNKPLWS